MMKKMGIEQKDLSGVNEVIIRFSDKEWAISKPHVSVIKQSGSESYQISGTKVERPLGQGAQSEDEEIQEIPEKEIEIPIEDAALVAGQTGVDIEVAKQALIETQGDLAAAILKLKRT